MVTWFQHQFDILSQELTLEGLVDRLINGKMYIKEKVSDLQTNISCLQTRLKVYAERRRNYAKRAIGPVLLSNV